MVKFLETIEELEKLAEDLKQYELAQDLLLVKISARYWPHRGQTFHNKLLRDLLEKQSEPLKDKFLGRLEEREWLEL